MQAKREKAGYGLVLALQVYIPHARLTCVQSLSAEYPDHPRQMFRLEVSDAQTAVALEDTEQDIRCIAHAAACCCIMWLPSQAVDPSSAALSSDHISVVA